MNSRIYIAIFLSAFFLSSCNTTSQVNINNKEQLKNFQSKNNYLITGKTSLSDFGKSFNTKAVSDFSTLATVSVIYPSDYPNPSLREATIATGLTDSNGNFKINPGFNPETNQVLILESSKRNKGVGYASLSMRTHIRWNGTKWESISGDNIVINKQTTTIALISSIQPDVLSASDTINKISINNSISTVTYDSKFTYQIYSEYLGNVSNKLSLSIDPINYYNIYYPGSERASLSSVKANMHTLQTVAETYGVDWQGEYAKDLDTLIIEAKNRSYWHNLKNPFNSSSDALTVVSNSDYLTAKTTLKYKGQQISDMTFFAGVVTYEPIATTYNNISYFTGYVIYGIDAAGEYIRENTINNNIFVLSNN